MKNNLKGYFVSLDTNEIWEISPKQKSELDKLYPDWVYASEDDHVDREEIYNFFARNGKLLAHARAKNVLLNYSLES